MVAKKCASYLLLILTFLHCKNAELIEKLDIDIFFEALCPDSKKFISDQLYPAWKDLAPYINIKFVPFGKSKSINGGESFECQHGPDECNRNKIMSCALSALQDQTLQVEYVKCAMTSFRKNDAQGFGHQCAELVGLNWNDIVRCYSSTIGIQLQLQAEQETLKIDPQFVPTIVYNHQFNQRLQDSSLKDFKGITCSIITQLYPEACPTARRLFPFKK